VTAPPADAVPGRPPSIAVDGPAAAGKSTVGRRLAGALGYLFFDTGLLYRALTLRALAEGADVEAEAALADLAAGLDLAVVPRPGEDPGCRLLLDGRDVTLDLRSPAVDRSVSAVSRHRAVRDALLGAQRRVAAQGPVVMVGRDVGTVVLPDAALKLYLDASPAARAGRRSQELAERGLALPGEVVLADLTGRDAVDSGRAVAPLAVAADAVVVGTDACDVEGVVAHLLGLVARWPDALTTGGGLSPCPGGSG
jgi:cytidylate kinase